MSSQEAKIYSNKRKSHSNGKKAKTAKLKRSQSECEPASFTAIDPEGLPMTVLGETGPAKVGIISMFDGVGSVYHIIKKKLGKPPAVYIAAEHDPVLRRFGFSGIRHARRSTLGLQLRRSGYDIC